MTISPQIEWRHGSGMRLSVPVAMPMGLWEELRAYVELLRPPGPGTKAAPHLGSFVGQTPEPYVDDPGPPLEFVVERLRRDLEDAKAVGHSVRAELGQARHEVEGLQRRHMAALDYVEKCMGAKCPKQVLALSRILTGHAK